MIIRLYAFWGWNLTVGDGLFADVVGWTPRFQLTPYIRMI
jgi:hypothetical protein